MVIKKRLNIIILGASGSIGYSLSNKFYKNGHNIFLFIKNKNKINLLKKKFKPAQGQIVQFKNLDISNRLNFKKNITENKNLFKKADIIVNTIAEQGQIKNFFKLNINKFYQTFNTNFFSYIHFFRYIYPYIKHSKNLLIILFSGGGVTGVRNNFSPYSLSKIVLVKMIEILSKEFNNKNIRINAVSPGIIRSKMTNLVLKTKKNLVSIKEKNKINKQLKISDSSLNKIYDLIKFLYTDNGRKITGKIISSRWDKFKNWDQRKITQIVKKNIYTLRRKEELK
jgi:short-subunit dehydrogenase